MHTHISDKKSGQTLIEVVISVLILAITTVSVFSIFFSNSVQQPKADKKEQAAMLIKTAQQTLQAFVSVDPANYSPNGGRWPADASNLGWALAAGRHDISSLMNGTSLQARNAQNSLVSCRYVPNCTDCCYMTYVVTDDNGLNCMGGTLGAGTTRACKTVVFNMRY